MHSHSQVTYSVTTSFSYETGGSATETRTDTTEDDIEVPPRSKIQAVIRSNRYTVDVPYTATVTPEFPDGLSLFFHGRLQVGQDGYILFYIV